MSVGEKILSSRICGWTSFCFGFYFTEKQGAWFVVILRVA